jgi:aminoglycoside 6'-N-acetyltransferase I
MALLIRPATLSDAPLWASMRLALWPENHLEGLQSELKGMLETGKFHAWLAFEAEGARALGFAEVYIRDFANGCESQPLPFLEGIWVEPSVRRQGLGRQLIQTIQAWSLAQGFRELGSDAELHNSLSHQAHAGWGFEETERVVYFRKKLA